MLAAPTSPLVAVDANVVMDLGEGCDAVLDALTTLRQRLLSARFVIPPTPQQELLHIARWADTPKERKLALAGIQATRHWRIVPVNLMPVGHGIVARIAERLRERNLLPVEEINDSLLVAESALLEARLLLSSDEHLRGMDFARLSLELHAFDLIASVIATPAEVARKFFLH
jgi:predicted nucleic acid-binding protein